MEGVAKGSLEIYFTGDFPKESEEAFVWDRLGPSPYIQCRGLGYMACEVPFISIKFMLQKIINKQIKNEDRQRAK